MHPSAQRWHVGGCFQVMQHVQAVASRQGLVGLRMSAESCLHCCQHRRSCREVRCVIRFGAVLPPAPLAAGHAMYRVWHRVQCRGPTLGGQSQLVPFQVPCRQCLASACGGGPFSVYSCEVLELVAPLDNPCACSLQRRRRCSHQHPQTGSTLLCSSL